MGLDAVLFAVVQTPVHQSVLDGAPYPCQVVDSICLFGQGCFAPKHGTIVECVRGWRFYGPGYQRGPWNEIAEVIHWMRATWPEAGIFYGGDNWPMRDSWWKMTPERENEITDLFFREGNETYYQAFIDAGIPVSEETRLRICPKS